MAPALAQRPARHSRAVIGAALVLGLALFACDTGRDEPGERFTLTFQPPEGTRFIQQLKVTRVQEFSEGGKQTHASESATLFTIEKAGGGYRVRAEEVSTAMTRDDQPVEDPVTELLRAMPATFETDSEGKLQGIRGFEDVSDRIATELPSELSSVLASVVTEETLVERGTAEWNGRFGDFVGKTIEIGDLWASAKAIDFPGEVSAVQYTATWFPETAKCNATDCVRIRIFRDTDLEALQDKLEALVGKRATGLFDEVAAEAPSSDNEGFRSSSQRDRLVDPSTLLPHEESQQRLTIRPVQIPGQASAVLTITETRQYAFEYLEHGEVHAEGP